MKSFIPVVSSVCLVVLFCFTWYQFSRETRVMINQKISEDITELGQIFKQIDANCGIAGFDHDKNYIDFLTVQSFKGDEVGALKLVFPQKWNGPYLNTNPVVQGKKYEIVRAKRGYYIVPGTSVELANGKIMGKDIVITPRTDMETFMSEQSGLMYNGKELFAFIWAPRELPEPDLTQPDEDE